MYIWPHVCKTRIRLRVSRFFQFSKKFVYIVYLFVYNLFKNKHLSNTFWLHQHRVKYSPILSYSLLLLQFFKWNTLYEIQFSFSWFETFLEKGKITQNALFSEKDANRRRLNQNFLNAISFHFVRFLKNPVIKMIQNLITNPRLFMSCVYFQLGLEFY